MEEYKRYDSMNFTDPPTFFLRRRYAMSPLAISALRFYYARMQ